MNEILTNQELTILLNQVLIDIDELKKRFKNHINDIDSAHKI